MVQAAATTATFLYSGTWPIPVLGSKEGTGFVGGPLTSASNAAPTYITGLKANEIYELSFFQTGVLDTGTPVNVYIRPGGVATTVPVTTGSFLHPASKQPTIQIKLEPDQTSIGFMSSAAATSVTCFWRRLI